MAAAAADWSNLPKDILNLISEQLHNDFDLISFRSVCSHWRNSSINRHNTLHFKLPVSIHDDIDILKYITLRSKNKLSSFFYISKRSYFLIKPSQQDETLIRPPWLIRITQNSFNKTILFHPQFSYSLPSHYFRSTHLDFTELSVIHLGTDFIIDDDGGIMRQHPKKIVAVTPLILAILLHEKYGYKQRLVLFHYGDDRWTEIPGMPLWSIGEICIFKGWIYAVQENGRNTVAVGPEDLSVQLVANPVGMRGTSTKLLVESEGELLLVELLLDRGALMINVFILDEFIKKWVTLTSLGNRILFLGNGGSFSVSASDLSVAKGNCVIFMDDGLGMDKIFNNASGMCVFDLDQRRVSPLSDYPDYLNLFWPPPEWIVKSHMGKPKKRGKQRKRR